MSPRGSVIPMRGHAPLELAPPGDDAARHARVRRRSTSELGGRGRAVSLTHNIDAKLADIASTAARIARPVQAGRPWAQCGNIDPLRPPAAPSVNISFRVLAYMQSPRPAGSRIAVPQHRCFAFFTPGFLSAPAFAGTLVAPKTNDLQGVASRSFLHVAAVHPSLRSGERYFLSGYDRAVVSHSG